MTIDDGTIIELRRDLDDNICQTIGFFSSVDAVKRAVCLLDRNNKPMLDCDGGIEDVLIFEHRLGEMNMEGLCGKEIGTLTRELLYFDAGDRSQWFSSFIWGSRLASGTA